MIINIYNYPFNPPIAQSTILCIKSALSVRKCIYAIFPPYCLIEIQGALVRPKGVIWSTRMSYARRKRNEKEKKEKINEKNISFKVT